MSELAALGMGYVVDKDAIAFYDKASSQTDDPSGKAMYQYAVGVEKRRGRILEDEYNTPSKEFSSH